MQRLLYHKVTFCFVCFFYYNYYLTWLDQHLALFQNSLGSLNFHDGHSVLFIVSPVPRAMKEGGGGGVGTGAWTPPSIISLGIFNVEPGKNLTTAMGRYIPFPTTHRMNFPSSKPCVSILLQSLTYIWERTIWHIIKKKVSLGKDPQYPRHGNRIERPLGHATSFL